jgi:O-antigen ligase
LNPSLSNFHPVVDQFPIPIPLDPVSAAIFAAVFIGAAILTARRPAYGLCALIATTPFAFYRVALGTTVEFPKVALLGVLAGLLTYGGSSRLLRAWPMPLLAGLLAFYLLATSLSAFDATYLVPTVREILKLLQYLALFVAAYLCYRLDRDDNLVVLAVAAVTIAVSATALAQEVVGTPSGLYIGTIIIPRIAGVLEGPNQLAGYLEVAIATLGAWAAFKRSVWTSAALAIATCADVLTFSRAGLFALAVVVIVLAVAGGRTGLRALRPVWWGICAGLVGVAWWAWYAHNPDVWRISFQESAYAGGVGNRSVLWAAAIRMWLAHPLLGVGAGNYELLLGSYGVPGVRTHANSWYLESLAEGGLPLFAANVALVVAIIVTFARDLRSKIPWAVAALAASVALALHQVADYLVFFPKVGSAWWILLGIATASLAARSFDSAQDDNRKAAAA